MNQIESINLIYRNPEVRGGRPCIVGTGLRVIDIVMAMQFGNRSPEQMAEDYQVSLAKVHAALAFYYENKDEIDQDIHEDIRIGLELAQHGWGRPEKSKLLQNAFDNSLIKYRAALQRACEKAITGVGDDFEKRVLALMDEETV
ncbi:MAG: DUF433 domain-containing protein [Chloroflexota bacterium]|nr:DUF433 domain-containing protein [Chloroflexota bacterium]MDE2857791.1 DUF433 domain-containing protein [Chloroflexota bacterium]